jgi:hypothetical protein
VAVGVVVVGGDAVVGVEPVKGLLEVAAGLRFSGAPVVCRIGAELLLVCV